MVSIEFTSIVLQTSGSEAIGVYLAGILRGTHGEHRKWVGAEWGEVCMGGASPLQPTKGSGGAL